MTESRQSIKGKLIKLAREVCVEEGYYLKENSDEIALIVPIEGPLYVKVSYNFTVYDLYTVNAFNKIDDEDIGLKVSNFGCRETLYEFLDIINSLISIKEVFVEESTSGLRMDESDIRSDI